MRTVAFRPAVWATSVAIGFALASCEMSDSRNDPEPYREHIQKIENVLQKTHAEQGDGALLSEYATDLAGAMGRNIQQPRAKQTVMALLIQFGESCSAVEDLAVQYAEAGEEVVPFEMADVRKDWEALRELLFQPASWFK